MTTMTSRGEFLSTGMKGGIALVAGGAVLGMAAGPALGQATGDVAIAKLAATAELLAIDFYGKAIGTGLFKADELAYLNAAKMNEQDHYDALAKVLGSKAVKSPAFDFGGATGSQKAFTAAAIAIEDLGVSAYAGQGPRLK